MPYPNLEGKHGQAVITEPATFVRYWVDHGVLPADHRAPHGVVMLYQRTVLDAVLASHQLSPFAPRGLRNTVFLDLHIFDETDGSIGVIGGFGIGTPAATSTLESLAALGLRRFVGIGTRARCAASRPAMSWSANGRCATKASPTTTCRRRCGRSRRRP
ncbi:MAG: hypothetical protein ACR2HP_16780 [Ilumatobacteraceae bacterium]